mmetsp:Transcript_60042/g.110000  ORF Transcript_60042/g.110000 Transcript_60042/m.110000 type:complete len:251 (-) Transcript_60042:335-1087(-)
MSVAMMRRASPDATTASRIGSISCIVVIFASVRRTLASCSTHVRDSSSVINWSDKYPTSCSRPSAMDSSSYIPLPASHVSAPSAPTACIASAMSAPISSLFAEREAMFLYCSQVVTGIAILRIFSIKKAAALTRPRCTATELAPFSMNLMPALHIACVSTAAVVVPSPARSSVCEHACKRSLTPTSSSGLSTETLPAMETPSLMITGICFSSEITTFRPRGPRVTLTASATLSTPSKSAVRASREYLTIL